MKAAVVLALVVASSAAHAQPFIELGVGAVTGGCIANGYSAASVSPLASIRGNVLPAIDVHCSRGAIGIAAVGYQLSDRWRVQYEHWSSLPDAGDRGLELFSLRYRYMFR